MRRPIAGDPTPGARRRHLARAAPAIGAPRAVARSPPNRGRTLAPHSGPRHVLATSRKHLERRRRLFPVMAQHHRDAAVARQPGGNPHLEIVVGHDQRAVLERQARPDGARLALSEASRQARRRSAQARAALSNRRTGNLAGMAVAVVPGRSEYGTRGRATAGLPADSRGSLGSLGQFRRGSRRSCWCRSSVRQSSTMASTSSRWSSSVYGRRISASIRLLACCSGRWKCGAKRPGLADESDDLRGAIHRLE